MNKENIPTAKEFLIKSVDKSRHGSDVEGAMIDFAKFHCEAQVKAMSDYINQCITKGIFPHDCHILNAYPLTNIK